MSTPRTYLQLAQALRREVGANGTGPASVLNQTGEYDRIVNWIADADEEIQQELGQWKFMAKPFALNTAVGQMVYTGANFLTPATDISEWRHRTIKCYLLSAGKGSEYYLDYVDYEVWDATYNTANLANSVPCCWTVGNARELIIGGAPADVYRITGEYFRTPTRMTADSDTPSYPAEFHMLPVYLAMVKYGRFTAASEVYNDGRAMYDKLLNRMRRTMRPMFNQTLPLA